MTNKKAKKKPSTKAKAKAKKTKDELADEDLDDVSGGGRTKCIKLRAIAKGGEVSVKQIGP